MADTVTVPLKKVAELLGLSADSDEVSVRRALDDFLSRRAAEKRAAAARESAERVVAAAIGDGRISAKSRPAWLKALAEDPAGTRRVIASLMPVPADLVGARRAVVDRGVDADTAEMERILAKLTGQPVPDGDTGAAVPRINRDVMAAQASSTPRPATTRSDAEILEDPAYRDVAWRLGPRARAGLKPPEARWTGPDPLYDDEYTPELIENSDGTAYWKPGPVRSN